MFLLKTFWSAQLIERQSAVQEVEGSSSRPDQTGHACSVTSSWEEHAAFVIISAND